jgi:adenylate cyclase
MTEHRKLAAILAADAVGYSRLMADDEVATVRTLNDYRRVFSQHIDRHEGRLVDTAGDSVLAVFDSPHEALECATEIQTELARRNRQLAEHRRMQFRIGINLGDVLSGEDGTVYGDGVNIAARLQALADPAGVCISGNVFEQVERQLPLRYIDIGEQQVKNIPKRVKAYKVVMGSDTAGPLRPRSWRNSYRRVWTLTAITMVLLAVAGAIAWKMPSILHRDPATTMPTGPTFAVLPFANLSGQSEEEYFSDGITEEIITGLARFKNARVLARNSTFKYKGHAVDVRQVASELGADLILEGSVRRAADRIRITAQLLDGKDGGHIWAETYERELTPNNIFAIQDEITQAITATVAGSYGIVVMSGWSRGMQHSAENLSSYECVLRARWYNAESLSAPDHLKVRACLEQAVQRDPGYADAWAWLAFVYTNEFSFQYNPRPDPLSRALHAALTAERLSPESGEVQRHLTMVHYFYRDPKFVQTGNRALSLAPNDPSVLAEVGLMFGFAGDWERGAVLMQKAINLSPKPPHYYYNYMALSHYVARRYREALTWAEKSTPPSFFWVYANRAATYGQLGRTAEAQVDLKRLAEAYPSFAENARQEYRVWFWREKDVDHLIDGLKKAGLNIPADKQARAD